MRLQILLGVVGLLTAAQLPGRLFGRDFDEAAVKAVYLFNFAQFVEWPAAAFADDQAPFVIGVLGNDPLEHLLDEAVRGEVVKTRHLVAQRYRRVEEIGNCHILYVSPSESGSFDQIFAALRGRAILTVGDGEKFTQRGGMIRFLTADNRVQLRVNLDAARAAGLTISSNLLRPAEIVGTQGER